MDFKHSSLPNGLEIYTVEDHSAPIVAVQVWYHVGSKDDPQGRIGFAHLFEHMMFQGSEHVGKFEHVRIVNQNGGILNGSTRFDHTNYFEVMPSRFGTTSVLKTIRLGGAGSRISSST